ncbi:hypothetical protein Bca4012_009457 [Brassica carinata]
MPHEMGHMVRLWRWEWKKNDEHDCHFLPDVTDCRLTVIMEDDERFESLETIV